MIRPLTSKCSRHKDGRKATNASNKRCIANEPVVAPNILMGGVSAAVDCNSQKYEYLLDDTLMTCDAEH